MNPVVDDESTLPFEIVEQLAACYREPHRHYHGLPHIEALLSSLRRYRPWVKDVPAVGVAIWFHDAIYDPRRDDNESRSADLARRMLMANGNTPAFVERVADLVLATQTHECDAADSDKALFLDLDLGILAAAPQTYDAYARQVRLEYPHVDSTNYRYGRSKVLSHFLSRPIIYRTPHLQAIWEAAARSNLLREQAGLLSPTSAADDGT